MKELDSFTVERLEEIIAEEGYSAMRTPKNDEVRALARIALAAKRAEESHSRREVWDGGNTWIQCSRQAYDRHEAAGKRVRVLYERPQLNSPEIPDGWKLVPIEPTQNMVDAHISGMQLAGFSRAYRDMLAAAPEPQNQQQNIPEIIPQGWTSSDPANAALVMLDRIDTMDSADDDRIEDIKLIIRQLAAAPEKENG
ncbi:hypothetical protein AB8888_22915 [Yersinia enterocolitica]|uniref:hypothetical protein n=1 Tax=Yersinia enterocolitica TaxID=630 RepID=UPI003123B6B2